MQANPLHDENGETRQRVLEAAGRLFAEKGYEATSVREITTEAGVNVASVSYYFGGKAALYQVVFQRILVELRELRTQRLRADLDAAGPDATLESFLTSFAHAFVEPLIDGKRAKGFFSMFDNEMRDPRISHELFLDQLVRPMLDAMLESLSSVGIELDRTTCGLCLMSLVGQLIHVLKARSRILKGTDPAPFPQELDAYIDHFVQFSAAGIRACQESQGTLS